MYKNVCIEGHSKTLCGATKLKKMLDKKKDGQIDENEMKDFLLVDVVYLLLFCLRPTRQNSPNYIQLFEVV